jgi:hypothetical protein
MRFPHDGLEFDAANPGEYDGNEYAGLPVSGNDYVIGCREPPR